MLGDPMGRYILKELVIESPGAGVLELGAGAGFGFGLSGGEFPMTKARKKMVKSRRENEALMLETIFNERCRSRTKFGFCTAKCFLSDEQHREPARRIYKQ